MDNNINTNDKRIFSFDIMRVVAICAVVMIHISVDFVKELHNDTVGFICGNFFSSISRFAVPVFFMISGALMLNEDKKLTFRKILHSTFSLFLLLVVWNILYSVAYHVIKPIIFKEIISCSAIVDSILNGHYHMWYLYVLIGLYVATPILRTFIKRSNLHLIRIYLILSSVVCFGGSFINEFVNLFAVQENILLTYLSNFRLDYIYEYLIYYILGWYFLNAKIDKKKRIYIYVGGSMGFVTTFVCTQLLFDNSTSLNNYFYSNDSLNVFLYSIATFIFLHYLFNKYAFRSNKFLLKLSRLTFGVYLSHPIFLFGFKFICKEVNFPLFQIVIVFLGAIITSFVSVYIVSKVPILKKMVRE